HPDRPRRSRSRSVARTSASTTSRASSWSSPDCSTCGSATAPSSARRQRSRSTRRHRGDGPMTYEEIERVLTGAIRRGGSLQAVKLWLSLHSQDGGQGGDDPFAEFDPPGVG